MKTKSTLLILMILLAFNTVHAQNYVWAKQMGGSDNDEGRSIDVDLSGNVYSAGTFYNTVDFDPGPGVANLVSAGGQDIYIQKLNANGNLIWAKRIGGTDFDEGYGVASDASGNVYVTGYFRDVVDFDPGAGTYNLTAVQYGDVFVLKLDAGGNFLWAKQIGGTGFDVGWSVSVDPTGNVYTTGWFFDTVDFDPGVASDNHTSLGEADLFIQKMDAAGNFLWAATAGGPMNDYCYSVDFDPSGNVYAAGMFTDVVDFDPGTGVANLNGPVDFPDIYVLKLDEDGNFVWAKQMGGISFDYAQSIAVDSSGNVYTVGIFQFTSDFDPGSGTSALTSAGSIDIYIQKLDTDGNFVWVKQIGGPNWEAGLSIGLDPSANVYITGYFSDTIDFNPGAGVSNLISTGDSDAFVQKMDTDGNFLWAKHMGGISTDFSQSIAVDGFENTYITGFFYDTADFNPGIAVNQLISVGQADLFVQKMSSCSPVAGSDTITACDQYTWIDGVQYTTNNSVATYVLESASGCDSIVTLNLTINYSDSVTDVIEACSSHTWIDGITYVSSNNTATYTFTNAAGCDSVVTLDLTILNSAGTDVITACNSYTWINGITYTASNNTASDTLTNAVGCDSIVTLNLTINSVSDVTTSLNGITISSNNSNAVYQWLRCGDGSSNYSPIPNETGVDFTPAENGYYAVEITENGCVDTSACVAITKVGLLELSNGVNVIAYPNPTKGAVYLTFSETTDQVQFVLTDVKGNVLSSESHHSLLNKTIELAGVNGIYFLTIRTQTGESTLKLVKE